ncbi:GNAT family N-acetyltransferase [Paenibacillus massiliensis]|uniref:GNAT family N-acetyltransferase n=1 Tax=Paenibacillus massiliensis TaxID=225917 RepID=UPI0003686F50|nr:GNAT family N-acetyltransferase [Paenibacillus massiliensis]
MQHTKIYQQQQLSHAEIPLVVEGPITAEYLEGLELHEQLDAFRRPREQHEALMEIAALPEGRVIIARTDSTIVGYVTFHYPDELERWSEANMDDLLELGAIEVASDYRSTGIGRALIQAGFREGQLDDYIVYTTEYYWHWDLQGSKLSVWDYRRMMEQLMKCVGMVWYATDDPEICSHPANCLMVRVGPNVSLSSEEAFDRVRFQRRKMY